MDQQEEQIDGALDAPARPPLVSSGSPPARGPLDQPVDQPEDDIDWEMLLKRISRGQCTPFIGAGASVGILPLGGALAGHFAQKWGYPLEEGEDPTRLDLARVAQYCAVTKDDFRWPKEEVRTLFEGLASDDDEVGPAPDRTRTKLRAKLGVSGVPNPDDAYQMHRVLAEMPIPIYITTNYDNLMVDALKANKSLRKTPQMRFCPWNSALSKEPDALEFGDEIKPSVESPLVYHFHGHITVDQSMVLTEDDYVDFLVNMAENPNLLHPVIKEAISGTSLLFVGYRLGDWDFRVLFRQLFTYLEHSAQASHVSVQLPKVRADATPEVRKSQELVQTFLKRSFNRSRIKLYWGSGKDFAKDLHQKWKEYNDGAQ